jgi:hypothetical protein
MRRVIVALAIVGLTFGSGVGVASARPAKAKITVTPNTGITNGMKVTVRGRGFRGFSRRPIYECTPDFSVTLNACTLLTNQSYSGEDGRLRVRVNAIVGAVGTLGGTCDADHSCLIVTLATYPGTKHTVSAPISFAP